MKKPRIEPALEARLKRLRLRPELPDEHTLAVKNVPASHLSFNKDRTNLLIKRSDDGMPWVVCVDDDLEYTGMDPALAHAFSAAAPSQQGWRVLTFSGSLRGDMTATLEYALGMLGLEQEPGKASAPPAAASARLLTAWARNLSAPDALGRPEPTLFRDEEIEQIASCTLGWEGRLPLILGDAGTGKTNLLEGVASLLARRGLEVLAVNMGALMAATLLECEREALLISLLREARDSGAILAMEQAEWAAMGAAHSLVLLRDALDQGTRMIATSTPVQERRFAIYPLESRLEIVRLNELAVSDTRCVLELLCPAIAAHHGVEIDIEVEAAVAERARPMEGAFPGKAVRLLDAAAARASLLGNAKLSLLDVYLAASRMQASERT
jgi:ATP-dependent Clp protease ATP-binding subunit ClpA